MGTTKKCPVCKEDLLLQRKDKSLYCQTCGYENDEKVVDRK